MKLKWKKEYWVLIGIIILIFLFLKPQNILFSTTEPIGTGNSTGLILGILFVVVLPILLISTGLGGGLIGVIAILILAAIL